MPRLGRNWPPRCRFAARLGIRLATVTRDEVRGHLATVGGALIPLADSLGAVRAYLELPPGTTTATGRVEDEPAPRGPLRHGDRRLPPPYAPGAATSSYRPTRTTTRDARSPRSPKPSCPLLRPQAR